MDILIWKIRQKMALTLRDMENLTGISRSAINNFENGKVSPTMNQMEDIAKNLRVRINDLFDSPYK